MAIAIITTTFIFPETLNHAFLVAACDLVGKVKGLLDLQEVVLSSAPEELAPDAPLHAKVMGARAGIVAQLQKGTLPSHINISGKMIDTSGI